MASWSEFEQQAPELAAAVAARFAAHRHHVMGTLRADGAPRLSGTEVVLWEGELWLGSMPGSRKAADLHRDPRVALHAATVDVELRDGDAKVSGLAVAEHDEDRARRFFAHVGAEAGMEPPEGELFRVALRDASLVRVEGDHLVIDSWSAGGPARRRTRT